MRAAPADSTACTPGASGQRESVRAHYLWLDVHVDVHTAPYLGALVHGLTSDIAAESELFVRVDDRGDLRVDRQAIRLADPLDALTQAYGRVHARVMDDAHRRDYSRIHAAAVEVAGSRVAIVGPSGAGKTSLALELSARGATVLGDEALLLRDGSSIALPRRVHVKSSGRAHLPPQALGSALRLPYSPEIFAVEPTALHTAGVEPRLRHAPVDLLVLLAPHGAPASVTDVSTVEALHALLADSGHYASATESLGASQARLVSEAARLAHDAPSVRIGGTVPERASALVRLLT